MIFILSWGLTVWHTLYFKQIFNILEYMSISLGEQLFLWKEWQLCQIELDAVWAALEHLMDDTVCKVLHSVYTVLWQPKLWWRICRLRLNSQRSKLDTQSKMNLHEVHGPRSSTVVVFIHSLSLTYIEVFHSVFPKFEIVFVWAEMHCLIRW